MTANKDARRWEVFAERLNDKAHEIKNSATSDHGQAIATAVLVLSSVAMGIAASIIEGDL